MVSSRVCGWYGAKKYEKREKHSHLIGSFGIRICFRCQGLHKTYIFPQNHGPWVSFKFYTFNIIFHSGPPSSSSPECSNAQLYFLHISFYITRLFVSIQIYLPGSHKMTYRLSFSSKFLNFPRHFFLLPLHSTWLLFVIFEWLAFC